MGRYTIGPTLMGRHTKGLILYRPSTIGRVVNNTNSVTLQSVNTRTENVLRFRENKDICCIQNLFNANRSEYKRLGRSRDGIFG